jgi:hypothetical protein
MARQKYSDEQIDFISDQLESTENTKGEIAEEFIKAFPKSGRKIENIKQKITKMATEKGVDLKDRVRGEARGVLGNRKMSSQNTLSSTPPDPLLSLLTNVNSCHSHKCTPAWPIAEEGCETSGLGG